MTPRVSVIVPVHDAEDTLERCVSSLLAQTIHDIEVVLVDDGSTDGSGRLCDALARADARVVVLRRDGLGVSRARNAGVEIASAEHVAFLDADDWVEPEALEIMLDAAGARGSDVVITGCVVEALDRRGGVIMSRTVLPGSATIIEASPPPPITDDLVNLLGYCWNKLYRRDLLRDGPIEFPSDVGLGEDMIFNADVLRRASTVTLLDRAFVHYVQHPAPTLGTRFHPDFLELRLRSIDAVGSVLRHWSVDPATVDGITQRLQVDALRSLARTTSERPGSSPVAKARHLQRARRSIDGRLRTQGLPASRRLQAVALRRFPALLVILAARVRSRLTRGAIS